MSIKISLKYDVLTSFLHIHLVIVSYGQLLMNHLLIHSPVFRVSHHNFLEVSF